MSKCDDFFYHVCNKNEESCIYKREKILGIASIEFNIIYSTQSIQYKTLLNPYNLIFKSFPDINVNY